MNLGDFNIKNLEKNLIENKTLSNFISNFINELRENLEKDNNRKIINNKYVNYWDYQNFIEDGVSAIIGLSRWSNDFTYYDDLSKIVDDSITEIAEKEGTLYRKKFFVNGSTYNIDKFEKGQITNITVPQEVIPNEFDNEDIIFQYDKNGKLKIRDDLKEKVIKLASSKAKYLREKEQSINEEFKKEGHIYEAFEDDGYIFLNDLTEERTFSVEDIDFVVDNDQGDGTYQVINGEYKKIDYESLEKSGEIRLTDEEEWELYRKKWNFFENYFKKELSDLSEGEIFIVTNQYENDYEYHRYKVTQYKENKECKYIAFEKDLPENVKLGDVVRKVDGKYILDAQATKYVADTINEFKQEIINNRNL